MTENIHPVTVPKWGMSMEEAIVVDWHVKEGQVVNEGDELLDIETSKIANAVEAPATGLLRCILAEPGSTVLVGQLLGIIAHESVDALAIDSFVHEFQENFIPPEVDNGEPSGSRCIDVNTQRIHYLTIESEDKETVPILLIHGFGGDCNNWLFNMNDLGIKRSVYALDLPGHGSSSKEVGDGSLTQLAAIVVDFLDAVDITNVHLMGHSMGAAVAMEVAKTHSDRVASLVLISPSGLGEHINELYIREFINGQSRRDLKQTLSMLFVDKSLVTREMVDNILKYKRTDGVTAALSLISDQVFPAGRQKDNYRNFLNSLTVTPVTIIWGRQDHIADLSHVKGLNDQISIHLIDGVGHMPQMEAASKVNKLLLTHIDSTM